MNKIKFKGTTLYRKKVVNNILDVYNNDTFDFSLDWYKLANLWTQEISVQHFVLKFPILLLMPSRIHQ